MTDRAAELGKVMSTETATSAAAFNDTLNEVKTALGGVAQSFFNFMLPALQKLAGFLQDTVIPVIQKELQPAFEELSSALGE